MGGLAIPLQRVETQHCIKRKGTVPTVLLISDYRDSGIDVKAQKCECTLAWGDFAASSRVIHGDLTTWFN